MSDLAVSQGTDQSNRVQELSIQWLSFKRVQQYTNTSRKEITTKPLEQLIERIINAYNSSKEKEENETAKFRPLIGYQPECAHQYETLAYIRSGERDTALAKDLKDNGVNPRQLRPKTSREHIFFFFRDTPRREIVALTSGKACESIRPCVNYGVPITIAGRILDPHRISEITRRCLLGNDIKESILNPSGRDLCKISNIYYLVESFRCRVKGSSSMMDLPFLDNSPPPEIMIRTGLLRVMKRLAMQDYPPLLDFFSKHIQAHRRPTEVRTYNNEGETETTDRDFEFLHFLTAVPVLTYTLDERATKQIFDAYKNSRSHEFSFRHKYLQDFLDADGYELQCAAGTNFCPLVSRPESIDDIINLLCSDDEDSISSVEAMQESFRSAKLRFSRKDGSKTVAPLIQYVEGEVRDENGNAYFKIRNMWFKLAVDFQSLLHDDFRGLLRQTLIKSNEEGQLPKPWRGNKLQGRISESAIKDKFKISKGIRRFMATLKKARASFVDEKDQVKHPRLVGDILKVEACSKHREVVNKELLSTEQLPSKKRRQELLSDQEETITKELKKPRPILTEVSKALYVANPLLYPLKSDPHLEGQYDAFASYLEAQHQAYALGAEDEESYNRAYLESPYGTKKGYLVFDQVCPNNIEPCDIAYYTDETLYLYHVKEHLGQHTRDACSQILNAAKELRSALSTQHEDNFLQLLWKEGTGQLNDKKSGKPSPWKERVKKQLETIGEEAFYSIFQDRKVVFVYAFLERPGKSIHQEAQTKSRLSAKDIGLDETPLLYQKLKDLQFLDGAGRLTGKFCASSQERFLKADEKFSINLYRQMKQYAPSSESTLAKIELLDTAREIRALGFEFKICEIQGSPGAIHEDSIPPTASVPDLLDDEVDTTLKTPTGIIRNGPTGFYNVGNSCYINAVLQALLNTPDLREHIQVTANETIPWMQGLKWCLSNHPPTQEFLKKFRKDVFEKAGSLSGEGAQQDAHEFLTFVLDQLGWKPVTIFTRFEYEQGSHNSKSEQYHDLSIGIENEKSLQDALNSFFAPEQMEADGKKIDPLKLRDGSTVDKWKQTIRFGNPPPNYLIVHLKRFRSDGSKIDAPLAFPEDERVSIKDTNGEVTTYEIATFINHRGKTSKKGHYTADVKNFRDRPGEERWIHCNDDELTEQPPKDLAKDAYIVFLKKTDSDT